MNGEPTIRDRWLGAICYVSVLVFIPILMRRRSEFLADHCRQGFTLLFAEIVLGLLVWVLESAFQPVPVLRVLVGLLLNLAYALLFIGISVLGFVKALSGERFEVPGLEDLAARVPVHARDDSDDPA
jgi:uncharacterized membrane protein